MKEKMKKLRFIFEKLKSKIVGFFSHQEVHYVNGSDNLPPPLTKEQEEKIFSELEGGDEKNREQLVIHNLRLVVYIARRFENTGVGIEDLVSIGTIGLIKAVNTFCPGKKI